jgi:CheY-like chemotaxis protein
VKILVVDDEELDLFINKKLLSLEYDTTGFTSPQEALRWAQHNDFDVAVIDYYLENGVFAGGFLKDLVALKGPAFKAFVVTNYVDEKQAADLKQSGFTGIIHKPLTLEVFRKKLNGEGN